MHVVKMPIGGEGPRRIDTGLRKINASAECVRGYGSPSGRHRQGKYPSERRKIKTCRRVREAVVVGLRKRALEKEVSEKGGKKVGFRAGLRKDSEERDAESARAAVRPQGSEAPTRRCLRAVKKGSV